jgi:precorrin-2 dehydrogenase/sirohydrochlorin ferrochelatase
VEPPWCGEETCALLPIVLSETAVHIGLMGEGDAFERRRAMLAEAGVTPIHISSDSDGSVLKGLRILFVAGLDVAASERLTRQARALGVLVNVEDVPALCDFHVPAAVRRGELIVTVSTGGKSPGLARLIREWLEHKLGSEWSGRLRELATSRAQWRGQGYSPSEVSRRTRDYVGEREWLS